jgi:hypothetical protein
MYDVCGIVSHLGLVDWWPRLSFIMSNGESGNCQGGLRNWVSMRLILRGIHKQNPYMYVHKLQVYANIATH